MMSRRRQPAGRLGLLAPHAFLMATEDWDLLDDEFRRHYGQEDPTDHIPVSFWTARICEYAAALGMLRSAWAAEVLDESLAGEKEARAFVAQVDMMVDADLQARAKAHAEVGPAPLGTVWSVQSILALMKMHLKLLPNLHKKPVEEAVFVLSKLAVIYGLAVAVRHPAWTQRNVLVLFALRLSAERHLLPPERRPADEIVEAAADTAMQMVLQRIDQLIAKCDARSDPPA